MDEHAPGIRLANQRDAMSSQRVLDTSQTALVGRGNIIVAVTLTPTNGIAMESGLQTELDLSEISPCQRSPGTLGRTTRPRART